MSNQKPSFSEWLTDRNITFIIISILVVYVLERFAKSMHQDIITPAFQKCLSVTGLAPTSKMLGVAGTSGQNIANHKTWQKVIINVLELSFSVIILFLLSRFVFKHDRPTNSPPKTVNETNIANTMKKDNEIIVHFVS